MDVTHIWPHAVDTSQYHLCSLRVSVGYSNESCTNMDNRQKTHFFGVTSSFSNGCLTTSSSFLFCRVRVVEMRSAADQ